MQPTRTGRHREPREFDLTQLHESSHGKTVHRDYAAHFFRWVTVKEATGNEDRVLDIGCGQDLPLIKILGHQMGHVPKVYVGVDLNPIPKKLASPWVTVHESFNFTERWAELRSEMPFTRICCFEVIEHMEPENGLKLLQGARELLAPGGLLFLSTPVFNGSAAVNHLHEHTIPELQGYIEAAGLAIKARYGTFGNVVQLQKVLTPEERILWDRWQFRLGNDGLSVVFATNHPDQSRNNLWVLGHPGE